MKDHIEPKPQWSVFDEAWTDYAHKARLHSDSSEKVAKSNPYDPLHWRELSLGELVTYKTVEVEFVG